MFTKGQIVECRVPEGYQLTERARYTIEDYQAPHYEVEARFTWPAYVRLLDDNGRSIMCHAWRFQSIKTEV